MTDAIVNNRAVPVYQSDAFARRLRRRYAAERRFRLYGIVAIAVAIGMLAVLLTSIVTKGYTAFWQHELALEIHFDPEEIDPGGGRDMQAIAGANYQALARDALRARFPEVESRSERRALNDLLSVGAGYELRTMVMENPGLIGTRRIVELPLSDDADQLLKGNILRAVPE
ncbi:MAG TPA: DUF3333 domain-containing protein, partial [Arenibaculum sp.]|nr:DUF3333 domain-containing protein [Arenibaculum sp.]